MLKNRTRNSWQASIQIDTNELRTNHEILNHLNLSVHACNLKVGTKKMFTK